MLSKLGQDGHDRGIRLIGAALSDAGFEVMLLPLFQTPSQVLEQLASEPSVDLVGISSLSGAHNELLEQLMAPLRHRAKSLPVVLGGIVPATDTASLTKLGIAAVIGPGSSAVAIADQLIDLIEKYQMTMDSKVHHPVESAAS
jgi:methylmalonyl-CoA mutase